MKFIPLSQGKFAKVDDEDFEELNKFKWCAHQDKDKITWYAERSQRKDGVTIFFKMHRVIMNTPKGMLVDHKNNDGLDNTRENLRNCTHSENSKNRRRNKKGSSKYLGVHFRLAHGKNPYYEAHIIANGKPTHIGGSVNEKVAAQMYNDAAIKYHGEFARLNVID